jgi:hypothetical protein
MERLFGVPTHFWRMLHDPVEDLAVVFVATNRRSSDGRVWSPVCRDSCAKLEFFPTRTNEMFSAGAIYCCEYADFRIVLSDCCFCQTSMD